VHNAATHLSDSRELIYFGPAGKPARAAPDRRALDPAQVASALRRDPLTEHWVIVAYTGRGTHFPSAMPAAVPQITGQTDGDPRERL
jgi:hypothetical protein